MNGFIPEGADIDAAIALIEVIEIQGNNIHIQRLQEKCNEELRAILNGATPAYLIRVILKAREQARAKSKTP